MLIMEYEGTLVSENERLQRTKQGKYFTSTKYKKIKEEYRKVMKLCKLNKPYQFNIFVSTYKDIDNIIKPLFDVMQEAEIIENDKYIEMVKIKKTPIKRNEIEKIEVYGYGTGENDEK